MGTEERGSEHQGRAEQPDNVVRLPRDWLGPRDELVPFGPRASEPPPQPVGVPAEDHDDADSPTAEAFWEGTEVLHPPMAEERDEPQLRPENDGPVPSRSRARGPRMGRRPLGWAAGAVAAALVAAVVVSLGAVSSSEGPVARPGAGVGTGSLLGAAGGELGKARIVLHLPPEHRGVPAPAVGHQRSGLPRARARGAGGGSGTTPVRAPASAWSSSGSSVARSAPAPVRYTPPANTITSTPAPVPVPRAPGSASTARGGGSGGGSASGPTGQGARVGPASCNC